MELTGQRVKHRIYGSGIVIRSNYSKIIVRFDEDSVERTFSYPNSFETFLTFIDPTLQQQVTSIIRQKKESELNNNPSVFGRFDPSIDRDRNRREIINSCFLLHKPIEEIDSQDFISLIRFAQNSNMCLELGCTTCGCMPFRHLLRTIGSAKIKAILEAVPENEVIRNLAFRDAYAVLYLIYIVCNIGNESPLMQCFFLEKERRHSEWLARIKASEEKKEKEMKEAEERRILKRKIRTEWREKHAAERAAICAQISKLPLEDQLRYICEPGRYAPGYYGIDFSAIRDDDLDILPTDLLTAIINTYPTVKDKAWKDLRKHAKQTLQFRMRTD